MQKCDHYQWCYNIFARACTTSLPLSIKWGQGHITLSDGDTHHGHPTIKTCTTSTHKRHQWRFGVNNNVRIPQTQTIFHSLERSRLNKQNRDNDISRLANFVQVRRRFSTCKSVIIINGVTTSLRGRVLHRYRFRLSKVDDTSLCQMETHTAVTSLQTYIWKANPITYAHAR